MQPDKTYTADVVEICDNGDAIVELPPELIETLGWKIGDTLDIIGKKGKVIIRNIDNDNRKKSLDKPA
jgi:bifunctional DNA-binding transcriptional regulator/antitoxin component of YhaV-PrlF toxin-antitoxin module